MKRRLRILIVFAGVLGLVMALNVSAASATNTGDPTLWTCDTTGENNLVDGGELNIGCAPPGGTGGTATPTGEAAENAFGPVGRNINPEGRTNGILARGDDLLDKNGFTILAHNPLCPFHDAPET